MNRAPAVLFTVAMLAFVPAMLALLTVALVRRDPVLWLVFLSLWWVWPWCYLVLWRPARQAKRLK